MFLCASAADLLHPARRAHASRNRCSTLRMCSGRCAASRRPICPTRRVTRADRKNNIDPALPSKPLLATPHPHPPSSTLDTFFSLAHAHTRPTSRSAHARRSRPIIFSSTARAARNPGSAHTQDAILLTPPLHIRQLHAAPASRSRVPPFPYPPRITILGYVSQEFSHSACPSTGNRWTGERKRVCLLQQVSPHPQSPR